MANTITLTLPPSSLPLICSGLRLLANSLRLESEVQAAHAIADKIERSTYAGDYRLACEKAAGDFPTGTGWKRAEWIARAVEMGTKLGMDESKVAADIQKGLN